MIGDHLRFRDVESKLAGAKLVNHADQQASGDGSKWLGAAGAVE